MTAYADAGHSPLLGRVTSPVFTHAQWCLHLKSRGCLSPQHRGCLNADYCVAHWALPSGDTWRYKRRSER